MSQISVTFDTRMDDTFLGLLQVADSMWLLYINSDEFTHSSLKSG